MKELNCHFISDEKGGLSQITHLIAAVDPSSPIHPTRPKFLAALSIGASIVTLEWLIESQAAGTLLSVDSFLISSAEAAEKEHNFSLQNSIANGILAHSNGGICNGLDIYLTTGVASVQGPSRATFKALIETAGAAERTKSSVKTLIKNGHAGALLVLTSDPATPQQIKDAADAKAHGATVTTFRNFFAVLLNQSFQGISMPVMTDLCPNPAPPSKKVGFAELSPKVLFSPRQKTPTPRPAKEVEEKWTLLFSTQIPNLQRYLCDRTKGDQDRGTFGPGTMNIISSNITGRKKVEVFDKHQILRFQSTVLPTFRGVFGNAGSQQKIMWDAYDTSGNVSAGAVLRTFEFTFRSREQMTIVLFIMFGGQSGADADNAVKVTEDFFDKNNETFCPQTPSKPPFPTIESGADMSIDEVDGTPYVQRPAPMSPKTAEETFGNDTVEYSQVY
jgi:hypothetical protein